MSDIPGWAAIEADDPLAGVPESGVSDPGAPDFGVDGDGDADESQINEE